LPSRPNGGSLPRSMVWTAAAPAVRRQCSKRFPPKSARVGRPPDQQESLGGEMQSKYHQGRKRRNPGFRRDSHGGSQQLRFAQSLMLTRLWARLYNVRTWWRLRFRAGWHDLYKLLIGLGSLASGLPGGGSIDGPFGSRRRVRGESPRCLTSESEERETWAAGSLRAFLLCGRKLALGEGQRDFGGPTFLVFKPSDHASDWFVLGTRQTL
jgi:hypothetical protein